MRLGAAFAAVCAAGLAMTACAGVRQAAPDGDLPPERPTLVVCAAILGTLGNAIHEGRSDRDPDEAANGYRIYAGRAAAVMGDVESRQAIASSFAFYDSLTSAQLSTAADMCLAAAPREVWAESDWW